MFKATAYFQICPKGKEQGPGYGHCKTSATDRQSAQIFFSWELISSSVRLETAIKHDVFSACNHDDRLPRKKAEMQVDNPTTRKHTSALSNTRRMKDI